ncbi:MBL fold metallo-hydrolase [Paenibacillus qinlingensis]|uniref:Glyoxylase-like metal-dependent hydrolase (Beta-lactamase superfamily II) n=1 Tax=Paenibacillus qinlingensis TaxID=1837343 RepID=A0ABU1NSX9_9BACL|nr:MBL fold metallo-hydrolase [Paenibacillus qinlingensis]MDR6550559.1 glyoxylase-like metal-dependent hydrolase (beta-lactamase superfamily II) [Paenibacillus qinlingensis]
MANQAGIQPLILDMNVNGNSFLVHAALLWDEQEVILVDTGIPGQLGLIREQLAEASFPFDKLTKIIITHHDMDHIGSLPELVKASEGRIEVLAHELGKPYIQGEVPTVKRQILAPPTKVDVTLQDGDILPYCGGIQVIFTPGHTPDHISLYHINSRTLITGDALTSLDGMLMPPNPQFTPDMPLALESVAKLLDYDIETVITFHGGVCTANIKERLAEIANGQG